MIILLTGICFILVAWTLKLSAKLEQQRKDLEYINNCFLKKFDELDHMEKSNLEDREHLLDRIHNLERKVP